MESFCHAPLSLHISLNCSEQLLQIALEPHHNQHALLSDQILLYEVAILYCRMMTNI